MKSRSLLGDVVNTSILAVGTVTGVAATAIVSGALYLPFKYTTKYFFDHKNKNYSG